MAQSTIKITFLRDALDGENVLFEVYNLDTDEFLQISYRDLVRWS